MEKSKSYGEIGLVISEVSAYELALDTFIAAVATQKPKLAKSVASRFPMKWEAKVEFCLRVLSGVPELRTMPIYDDGYWSADHIYYSSAQLFDVRNHLAHGAIFSTVINGAGKVWTAEKMNVERGIDGKGQMIGVARYKFTSYLLEVVYKDSVTLRKYFERLVKQMEVGETWERWYQSEKLMANNRAWLRDLLGNDIPSWLHRNEGQICIEFPVQISGEGMK